MQASLNMPANQSSADLGDFSNLSATMEGYNMSFDASEPIFEAGGSFMDLASTVSPLELMRPAFDSAPSSGSLGLLGTPLTPYDTSPAFLTASPGMFGDDYMGASYAPLFPTEDVNLTSLATNPMVRDLSSNSLSSNNASPGAGHVKRPSLSKIHTSSSGVQKQSRRRSAKDLPAITCNNEDPKDVKRARNTAAARVSRQKKAEYTSRLEVTIAALRDELKMRGYDGPLLTEYLEGEEE